MLLLRPFRAIQVDGADPETLLLPAVTRVHMAVEMRPEVPQHLVVDPKKAFISSRAYLRNSLAEKREVKKEGRSFWMRKVSQMVCRSGVDEQAVAGEMLCAAQHCPSGAHSMENVGFLAFFQCDKPFAAHIHALRTPGVVPARSTPTGAIR